jgi:hypothetical protein
MDFLDNLILGSSTPKCADKVCYPSATLRKIRCTRKHCTPICDQRIFGEFEFWAYALSERPLDRTELRKNIHSLDRDLRFSVWVRHSGCRDLSAKMRVVSFIHGAGKGSDRADHSANASTRDRDAELVRLILRLCKSNQQDVFEITVNIVDHFPEIKDYELLILFISHILGLPYSTLPLAFRLTFVLIQRHNFYTIFKDIVGGSGLVEVKHMDSADCADTTESRLYPRMFWWKVLTSFTSILELLIDFLICYERSDVSAIPALAMNETKSGNMDHWIKFLSCPSNMEKIGTAMEQNRCSSDVEEAEQTEETYFDFLIVQDELIKGQEEIKRRLSEKILRLEKERDDLSLQNGSLIDANNAMEEGLRECQEGYVSEIKKMLYESKRTCEKYERENLELKYKLYGHKRKPKEERPCKEARGLEDCEALM